MGLEQHFESIASCKAGAEALCGAAVGFRLRQRALHVYSEKERVPLFKQICDGAAPAEEKTEQLARLMNDSQASCRCLSTPPGSSPTSWAAWSLHVQCWAEADLC